MVIGRARPGPAAGHAWLPRIPLALAAALALAGGAGGCAEDAGELRGSIASSYPLAYDSVRLRKQEDFVEIAFLKRSALGHEAPLKIAAIVADLPAGSLALQGEGFSERVFLRRLALDGPSRFPDVDHGVLRLDVFEFRDGAPLEGSFEVAFVDGRTLLGEFSGLLEEVAIPAL